MIKCDLTFSEISQLLNLTEEFEMHFLGVSTLDEFQNNTIIFLKKIDDEVIKQAAHFENCLFITQDQEEFPFPKCIVNNTRLAMAKVLNYINQKNQFLTVGNISETAIIHPSANIGNHVVIEGFVYIGPEVSIGDNSVVKQGVKIINNVSVGDNCVVRENSVIGGQGFGVEKDESNNNFKIAQLGGVRIGNHVEIGALNTIVSGTIKPTIIEDYVKIDDHVHIAHNCHIMRNCIITAGVILSGSVTIGENVWVGPNSTVKNSLSIASDNLIGIGTLVTKNIEVTNETFAGVPGKDFKSFIKEKKALQFIENNMEALEAIIRLSKEDK